MSETKFVSWHDAGGGIHVQEVPGSAVCFQLGGHCSLCQQSNLDEMISAGRTLAIGVSSVICSRGEHPIPPLVIMTVGDDMRDVDVISTRTTGW